MPIQKVEMELYQTQIGNSLSVTSARTYKCQGSVRKAKNSPEISACGGRSLKLPNLHAQPLYGNRLDHDGLSANRRRHAINRVPSIMFLSSPRHLAMCWTADSRFELTRTGICVCHHFVRSILTTTRKIRACHQPPCWQQHCMRASEALLRVTLPGCVRAVPSMEPQVNQTVIDHTKFGFVATTPLVIYLVASDYNSHSQKIECCEHMPRWIGSGCWAGNGEIYSMRCPGSRQPLNARLRHTRRRSHFRYATVFCSQPRPC
jgi:hypothetical protein